MTTMEHDVKEVSQKLLNLAVGLKGRDPLALQRINGYVFDKTGKKLADYLGDNSDQAAKHALLSKLVSIVESGDLSELPGASNGQASTPSPSPAPAPKPVPPPPPPAAIEFEEEEEEPFPVAPPPADNPLAGVAAQLTAAIEALGKAAKPEPAPIPTEAIRRIVRAELAATLEALAKALK